MKVEYVDHMGSDLTVVNAARVSFNKEVDEMDDKQAKLIRFLADNGHWSPFAHTSIQFRFKAPIFVARQLVKHQVGMVWNEVSRRYVDDLPELYWPKKWRLAAENVKQGSSQEEYINAALRDDIVATAYDAVHLYRAMINDGCCPEQARMILPQNMYTEWYWTGSLYAWARVWNQRTDSHAQAETQEIIRKIGDTMNILFPVSWSALTKE